MKRSHYIIGGLALAMSMPSCLQAQTTQPKDTTMTRTVVVEQEYNPDIMDASKVNVLPKVEEPTVSKKEVEYATTFFPATSVPAGLMRPYTGKETQPGTTPGYVRAGYGNYGNLDILANYLFRLSQKDKLNVRFQMDGMDGKLTLPFTDGEKWNAFVLDLSFIGWNLLSTITFGIVGVLYVNPYVNTTWAEFYKVMRENALETGNATREELIGLRKEADI